MKLLADARNAQRFGTFTLLLITVIAMLNKQVSVFYIVYFFWFQELLRTIISFIFAMRYEKRENKTISLGGLFMISLFPLSVYLVFIVVLFGFMLNWGNLDLLRLNFRTMLFKNVFFNINLILFAAEIILYYYLNRKEMIFSENIQIFSRNHLILHISILLGALLQFLVVRKYENIFTPENLWGSVLVVVPFLILKIVLTEKSYKGIEAK